jgi:hypothetical protein
MCKIGLIAPILSVALTFLLAMSPASAGASDRLGSFDIELNAGSRVDQFDWTIAGHTDGTSPNILSELTWSDLEIFEVNTKAQVVMFNRHVPFGGTIKAVANYGVIHSGANQDSDYHSDNRTDEYSRSNNQANDGNVSDLTIGGGLVFKTWDRRLTMTPLVGLAQHTQDLRMHDGFQTIPFLGPFDGYLDARYDAEWRSGWLGCDLDFQVTPLFELHGSLELHAGEYEATADWNLRDDLGHPVSFKHYSDTVGGLVAGFGATCGIGNVLFNLDLNYKKWLAEDGNDTVYGSDGSISLTRLNEVNWESIGISIGLTVEF